MFLDIDVNAMAALFYYKDGMLFNKISRGTRAIKDQRTGRARVDGYRTVTVSKKSHPEHRIIYAICHGQIDSSLEIDHINGNRQDNRIENLRLVTRSENNMNKRNAMKTNTVGLPGVSVYNKSKTNKFKAQIKAEGKRIHLGCFATAEEALEAYQAARKEYFGEFA